MWDASALLLLLQEEPGWEGLSRRLGDAVLSSVNLAEVATKLMEAGIPPGEVRRLLEDLSLEVHDFSPPHAYAAAELRRATRSQGLSLGDRACIALGTQLGTRVLTADRAWSRLPLGIEVELVR